MSRLEYDLYTQADGSISGTAWTNDNRDLGYPNESETWEVQARDREAALKRFGTSRVGCSGIRVSVYLDGKELR